METIRHILDPNTLLTGNKLLDSATIGIHHYDSLRLHGLDDDFSPPHKDSGTLTLLIRPHNGSDGLEVADLQTTAKHDSEEIGLEASFIPVPTACDQDPEVVVFAGTRLQRLLGPAQVRACVHRVRGPGQRGSNGHGVQRLSIAIFCAPSAPSV